MDIGSSPSKNFSKEYQSGALSFEIISNNKKLISNCGYYNGNNIKLNESFYFKRHLEINTNVRGIINFLWKSFLLYLYSKADHTIQISIHDKTKKKVKNIPHFREN